jgi:hypothetical protein
MPLNQDKLKRVEIYGQMRQLESSFNPDATELVERFEQGRELQLNQANVELLSGSVINEETTTFNQG